MKAPYRTWALFIGICFGQLSCENDLRDVEQISSQKLAIPVDTSTGVTVIYSDSSVVKAKLMTPELLHFKTKKPYYEMKKGVTVIIYDPDMSEKARITSDYAIRKENEKITEFRKNVIVTGSKGETFKSEELLWDETKRKIITNKPVVITTKSGTINGTGFEAPENNLSQFTIYQGNGNVAVPSNQGF